MCTSIAFHASKFYFGRNLDLDHSFQEHVTLTPRNFLLPFRKEGAFRLQKAIVGMANVTDGFPLYAEAANEDGLCIAGLNFPQNAVYGLPVSGKYGVTPFELPLWLLGQCSTALQAKGLLEQTTLIDIPFCEDLPLTPLHWHVADKDRSFVLESTKDGTFFYDNEYGVLTNNPPFPFHQRYTQLFCHLHNRSEENEIGLGTNAIGLPGDYSSPSRFVKAAWLNAHSTCEEGEEVAHFFAMLAAVAPVKGSVFTPNGRAHFCRYSCCIDVQERTYYYKRYDDLSVQRVPMTEKEMSASSLTVF